MSKNILIQFTEELLSAVDKARGESPRGPWLESQLWKLKTIREAARDIGVSNPHRPLEGRGRKPE